MFALLTSWFALASVQLETSKLLMARGLTRREADSVEVRHRRRNKAQLDVAELRVVLDSLDTLELLPEQAAHLLRSTPLPELLASTTSDFCTTQRPVWCSYKKSLCECGASRDEQTVPAAPRFVAVDCEFSPLRVAAVDGAGCVRLDGLVLAPGQTGTPPKSRGMLGCDIASTPVSRTAPTRTRSPAPRAPAPSDAAKHL